MGAGGGLGPDRIGRDSYRKRGFLFLCLAAYLSEARKGPVRMVKRFTITSDLLAYAVCCNSDNEPIDTDALCQNCIDVDDYLDAIRNKETTLRMAQQNPEPSLLLDTPGINDTIYRDVEHAKMIKTKPSPHCCHCQHLYPDPRGAASRVQLLLKSHPCSPGVSQQRCFCLHAR